MAIVKQNDRGKSHQHVNVKVKVTTPSSIPKALVIGAGPSGLVTAKYLLSSTNPRYEVTILEASDAIGGTFVNKVYDNARLVSSKFITGFSDFRMKEDYPDHPSAEAYVEYLNDYAQRFGIVKYIKFGCTVVSLKDNLTKMKGQLHGQEEVDANGYTVSYHETCKSSRQEVTEHFDVVSVCSGLHNIPSIPMLPSFSKFKGPIIHSSQYNESSIFTNKRVLVLGSGETAMDIALRAIQNPQSHSVALNVRRGFLSIPHNLAEDRPLDVFITNLFEHSYEHPWVHNLGVSHY